MWVAFTVGRNTHRLRIKDLNSIKALTPLLSFQVYLDLKTYYPEIIFCLISSSQGLCTTDGACVPGCIMLLKKQWKSVSTQGLAPEFDCFLFLPHLVQLVLSSRTRHTAHSLSDCCSIHCLPDMVDKGCKRGVLQLCCSRQHNTPKPCAGRNAQAMLCWGCASIPIQAQASLAAASKGWGLGVTPQGEIWSADGMTNRKIRGIFSELLWSIWSVRRGYLAERRFLNH